MDDAELNDALLSLSTSLHQVLLICSASLSVIGSSAILFKILRDRGSMTPYDRIIFGLSCGDIVASIYFATFTFLLENPSQAICRAFGVLGQLAVASYWYNGLLSFYFLLTTVLSKERRKDVVRKCEPWMHLSGIYFPIAVIVSISFGWNELNDAGTACEFDPIFLLFAWIPIGFMFLCMIINYGIIYAVLRKSFRLSNESSENVAGLASVQKQIQRETTTIMLLYVGCFFVQFLPGIAGLTLGALGVTADLIHSILLALVAILTPLQGFFNAFIYLKPNYTRFRAANPNKSMYFAMHQALFNPKVPRLNYSSDPTATTNSIAEGDYYVGITGIDTACWDGG